MNIIITGAGKGIGYETARKLADMGEHKIIAVSRHPEAWVKRPHPDVIPLPLDIEKPGAATELAAFTGENLKIANILINNAGYLVNKPFSEQTAEDFDRQFSINVRSVFLIVQALLPYFGKGSHIVNISSMGGFQGSIKFPGLSLYSSAKAALCSLTECLATELVPSGISINCLTLGAVQTEMLTAAFPGYKAPLTAQDMADFIAYFAMNGSRYFNGKIIPVSLSTP
jgi:3-oxoacyl-[acyl-carrier protein] reductase